MTDIRPDRLTTCQSELKSGVSRRPSVRYSCSRRHPQHSACKQNIRNNIYATGVERELTQNYIHIFVYPANSLAESFS
jgi:hypothetical protein